MLGTVTVPFSCLSHRFLFNCGEGFQRYCLEHRVRLSKIDTVALTRVSPEATGGIPGTMLTLAGQARVMVSAGRGGGVGDDGTFRVSTAAYAFAMLTHRPSHPFTTITTMTVITIITSITYNISSTVTISSPSHVAAIHGRLPFGGPSPLGNAHGGI